MMNNFQDQKSLKRTDDGGGKREKECNEKLQVPFSRGGETGE